MERAVAEESPVASRRARVFLAICGTLFLSGVGHWIVGARRRGIIWFAVATTFVVAQLSGVLAPGWFLVFVYAFPFAVCIRVAAVIDSWICARRSRRDFAWTDEGAFTTGFVFLVTGIITSLLIAGFLETHVVRLFAISSNSMTPTILNGDHIAVRLGKHPRRWEIVIYHPPIGHTPFVGRVAGLPGDLLEIRGDGVWVGGQRQSLPEGVGPFIPASRWGSRMVHGNGYEGHPIQLGRDEYFILGDETARAFDSRLWSAAFRGHQLGALPSQEIVGVAIGIYLPLARARALTD
jgi:signal peptidase I